MIQNIIKKTSLTLFYSQQTLILFWCLMSEKITGTLYVGQLSTLIFITSIIGNTFLGPLKGLVDASFNKNEYTRVISGIIPQLIFMSVVYSIYHDYTNFTVINIIMWNLIGMPFISANDCMMDDATTSVLNSSSTFAIIQYIGTKILARITFAYMIDNYNQFKYETDKYYHFNPKFFSSNRL